MGFVTKGRYDLVYRDFTPACQDVIRKAVITTGLFLKTKAEKLTPVDTSRARSNWHFSGDRPILSVTSPKTKARVNLGKDDTAVWFLTNNVHYMEYIEEGSATISPHKILPQLAAAFPKVYGVALNIELKKRGLGAA